MRLGLARFATRGASRFLPMQPGWTTAYAGLAKTRLPRLLLLAALQAQCAFAGEPAAAPATTRQEIQAVDACEAQLRQMSATSAQSISLRRLFKKNLHFRGDRHIIVPHWTADYSDFKNVFSALTPADIPSVVYLLQQGNENGGMRSMGLAVLRMFGPQAVPCINAAIRDRSSKGYLVLQSLPALIAAESVNSQP